LTPAQVRIRGRQLVQLQLQQSDFCAQLLMQKALLLLLRQWCLR
jgi:hypothetical protein